MQRGSSCYKGKLFILKTKPETTSTNSPSGFRMLNGGLTSSFVKLAVVLATRANDPLKDLFMLAFGSHVDSMAKPHINREMVYFSVSHYTFQ